MLGVASRRAAAAALGGRRLGVRMASTPPQGSLIPQTLREMEVDADFLQTARLLREKGQKRLTLEEKRRRRRALDSLGIPEFEAFLHDRGELDHDEKLRKGTITTLQVNVGLYCNQACSHCHVESSPRRKESMDVATVEHLLAVLNRSPHVHTVDITGGAPEFSAAFRPLVIGATLMGKEVIDRCNLTVLLEPSMAGMAQFLADHRVRVVASLPCYSQRNVDVQRGSNVFDRSITALQMLNDLGYGDPDSGLKLDLVYNPGGPFLPPPQETLRSKYGEELAGSFGIRFNELFTMTNMPIKRFADFLYKQGELTKYMQLLVEQFNPKTLPELMCRSLLSVSHDGSLFDCDFNQALDIGLGERSVTPVARSIFDLRSLSDLEGGEVQTGNHCFGCTAGVGSS